MRTVDNKVGELVLSSHHPGRERLWALVADMQSLIQYTNLKFHTRGRDKLILSDLLKPPAIFVKRSFASLPQIPVLIHGAE